MQNIPGWDLLGAATHVVLPDTFIKTVMEIKIFHIFKFCAGGGEEFFTHFDMRVHRTAHIKKQQHFHRIMALWHHLNVQPALFGGGFDGVIQVEFRGGPFAGKLT